MNPKNENIILSFDLDYTLIDNTEGILNSFNYALNKYHISKLDDESIKKMIGIPLNDMFSQVSDLDPSLLSASFREYYADEGIYQVKLYSGVYDKLKDLSDYFLLGIITSKKEEMAIKLLKFLKIDHFFDYIIGESENIKTKLDPELKKILLLRYPNYKFVVIGDHPKDKYLSEMLECPFIGVLTGHHQKEELIKKISKKDLILEKMVHVDKNLIFSLFDDNITDNDDLKKY